ncbi:hypothetical protein PIB30_058142, partial [Stylosanthes scabra]|nr:hypothetical protein [Stylosanthes scabra]
TAGKPLKPFFIACGTVRIVKPSGTVWTTHLVISFGTRILQIGLKLMLATMFICSPLPYGGFGVAATMIFSLLKISGLNSKFSFIYATLVMTFWLLSIPISLQQVLLASLEILMVCVLKTVMGSSILREKLYSIWRGLVLAWEAGIRNIICESDSLKAILLLRDIDAAARAMNKDLTSKILELLSRNWNASLSAVLRKANVAVDSLAKYAAWNKSPYKEWLVSAEDIFCFLNRDLDAFLMS